MHILHFDNSATLIYVLNNQFNNILEFTRD